MQGNQNLLQYNERSTHLCAMHNKSTQKLYMGDNKCIVHTVATGRKVHSTVVWEKSTVEIFQVSC